MPFVSATDARAANYACASISLAILFARIIVSTKHRKPVDLSLVLVAVSSFVVIARLIVNFYYLRFGTASDALGHQGYFDTHDLEDIKTGTILSLVARILITATCWLQICLLLLFYSHIMAGLRWVELTIKATWVVAGTTFVAVVLTTYLECRPFYLYWQISPDPGSCVRSYLQLMVQCISNIVLDLMLLAISWPILSCRGRSWEQRVRVGVLFLLGTFCIIVTTLRLIYVFADGSGQTTRSLWASVQMVVSTFVANVPTIYGDVKISKRKQSDARIRRMSRPEVWPQDTEAFGGLVPPSRIATSSSQHSARTCSKTSTDTSSVNQRKDWFDHVEVIDPVKFKDGIFRS